MGSSREESEYTPLFETKKGKGRLIYSIFAASICVAICMVWIYRATVIAQMFKQTKLTIELWGWICMFCAEIWFGFYWFLSQSLCWNPVYRFPFRDRLLMRYKKEALPKVDIFVCTADPTIEPPIMVVNTVLSVMAYDYPPEKLSIYLSDDGGSILTFYALFEASLFCRAWLPYCRKYDIEPRSPAAYFASLPNPNNVVHSTDSDSIKKLYEEMQHRIETSSKLNQIPEEIQSQHKGFSQWNQSYTSKHDHDTILEIMINGKDPKANQLPMLVYLAREKRPQHFHNYKAGAMNALIRVSAEISNGAIIMNVDCDMYSNNSKAILDALCFFMDDKKSNHIAFVQSPQRFENITHNDIYSNSLSVVFDVDFPGFDGAGGPLYIGTGCFHKREVLCGRKYSEDYKFDWKLQNDELEQFDISWNETEERAKKVATSTYELNSLWGKQVGLKYGCAIEDVITGLTIQCGGWKSVYLNPKRPNFVGLAATTFVDTLVQHKRWSEGHLQIMVTYFPLWYGHNKITLALQLGYCYQGFWAINSFPTLSYCIIPSLYMLMGISLFPEVSNPWILPFIYNIIANYTYSLAVFLYCGGTLTGWLNEQRMWLYKRTSSYLFSVIDMALKLLGFTNMKFVITAKVSDSDVMQRYEKGVMEFGVSSPMITILTCLSLINLFAFMIMMKRLSFLEAGERLSVVRVFWLQILLCVALVWINLPLYEAIFIRKDKGKVPQGVTIKAGFIAILGCALVMSSFQS